MPNEVKDLVHHVLARDELLLAAVVNPENRSLALLSHAFLPLHLAVFRYFSPCRRPALERTGKASVGAGRTSGRKQAGPIQRGNP